MLGKTNFEGKSIRWMAIIFTVTVLSCGGAEGNKSTGVQDLSDGESGTADGEYLDDETEVVIIHGGDDSYVFDGDDLEDATIEVDGEEVSIEEATKDDPICQDENAQIDVIVVEGEIVDIICYLPPEAVDGDQNYVEVAPESGDTSIPQNDNNKVIIFDESTNGEPIDGNVEVDSNNVAIYGNGADNTIIDGDVTLSGNNPVIRGVTVTGDLIVDKNNAAVLFCRVLGNIIVVKNNITIAATEILGDLVFDEELANNAIIVNNFVAGKWDVKGNGHLCKGNIAFVDTDENSKFTDGEGGEALNCGD